MTTDQNNTLDLIDFDLPLTYRERQELSKVQSKGNKGIFIYFIFFILIYKECFVCKCYQFVHVICYQ